MDGLTGPPEGPVRRRSSRVHLAGRLAVGLVVGAGALTLLLGRSQRLALATRQIGHARPDLLVLACLAEVASVLAFARLQRLLLASGGVSVGMKRLTAITLGGTALQNSFPGGAAWSTIFAFRQFRRQGADRVLAGWVVVVEGVLVVASVTAIAGIGVAVSTGSAGLEWVLGVTVGVGIGGALIAMVARGRRRAGHDHGGVSALKRLVARLRAVSPSSGAWLVAEALALANVLADCGCLVLAFAAVRQSVPWLGLLTAYAVGQLASRLTITPGGLGLVEGGIAVSLAAYGFPAKATIAAVLLYRLISYWGLILAGWPAILWLARSAPVTSGAA